MMPDSTRTATLVGDRGFTVERLFDAPRELVFKAFTEPERLMQWWGPRTYETDVCTIDLRVGGIWHYRMRSETGDAAWGRAEYQEITPPARLVYLDAFSDENGSVIPPKMVVEIDFIDKNGKTLVKSTVTFDSEAGRDAVMAMGMEQGLAETWDRLEEYLAAQ